MLRKNDYILLLQWIWVHLPPCRFIREGNIVTCHIQVKENRANIEKLKGLPFGNS